MQLQVDSLRKILGYDYIRDLAIETGFCCRTSKLTPEIFFDLLFYASSMSQNSSLEYLVSYLENQYGIIMRKQSLDERFTVRTVNFVKRILGELLCSQFSDMLYTEHFLSAFGHVRIKDSTKFNIPSNLSSTYKGSGGSGGTSDAGISIQYEFDLKTGKFLDLTITEATRNDQTDATQTAENVCKDDLVIRDLGYFSTHAFKLITNREAYFLSRLLSSVTVYAASDDESDTAEEIDFQKCFDVMQESRVTKLEIQVLIGKEEKLPVRLYIGLVPPAVYEERVRRKEAEEKRKGRQMKAKTKLLLRFNLFVTNAEEEKLPLDKIMPLYQFRWQVELMFKNWKSVFAIHKLQKMKEARYITMLYIRLILIIVNLQIIHKVQSLLYAQQITDAILSIRKTLQTMKNSFSALLNVLRCKQAKAAEFLADIYRMLSKNHWREKRKKRLNFIENISLFSCISDE